MKLKKKLKLYYSVKIRSMSAMTFPQSVIDAHNSSVRTGKGHRDLLINVAAHFVLILIVIWGIYSSGNSSALSERLTERAEEIALNDIIEHKISQLSSGIKSFKENNY